MYSITALAEELKLALEFQEKPRPISDDEYVKSAYRAIKKLYADTNRASEYKATAFLVDEETGECFFSEDLDIIEEQYVLILAQIDFLNWVKGKYTGLIGYSTDALKVTNADKPYANAKDAISSLENERRIIYYKMVKYCM